MSPKLEQLAEAIAPVVAEKVVERVLAELGEHLHPPTPELVDAAEIAKRYGVSRDYVYSRATELGAISLGTGPRARLRFDPEKVARILAGDSHEPDPPRTTTKRRSTNGAAVELLPIRGERR